MLNITGKKAPMIELGRKEDQQMGGIVLATDRPHLTHFRLSPEPSEGR